MESCTIVSSNEASLPPAQTPYQPSSAEAIAEVAELRRRARQQLDRLIATLAQLDDFLETVAQQQHSRRADREGKHF